MTKVFNVLMWNFNSDSLVHYDVLPYFRERYNERVKRFKKYSKRKDFNVNNKYYKVPETVDDFKEFVKNEGMYMFWSRCEYEIIVTGWPQQKNEIKIDVWRQIEMNIDIIVDILMGEFVKK